jgi:hypothetical protein
MEYEFPWQFQVAKEKYIKVVYVRASRQPSNLDTDPDDISRSTGIIFVADFTTD